MYGLGLSIWQLYTGEIPHGDIAGDNVGLKEKQCKGETVDVVVVQDPEAREIITGLLRRGGAWTQHEMWLSDECDASIGTSQCVNGLFELWNGGVQLKNIQTEQSLLEKELMSQSKRQLEPMRRHMT